MYCEKCGEKLNKDDQFCEKCGTETKKVGKYKKPILKKWWFWLLAVLVIVLIAGGIFGFFKYKENKAQKYNKGFESQYQHVTSFRYGTGETKLQLNDCKPLEHIDLGSKVNDFDLRSNKDEVDTTVDRFVKCTRDSMGGIHSNESEAISELSGKINGLQTKEQKALAGDLVTTLRGIVNNEEAQDGAWRTYYNEQIDWAYAIKSYINGDISLSQRNQTVDAVNKAADTKASALTNLMQKGTELEGKRDDIFSRLNNLMPK